jgi:hypothetical protein
MVKPMSAASQRRGMSNAPTTNPAGKRTIETSWTPRPMPSAATAMVKYQTVQRTHCPSRPQTGQQDQKQSVEPGAQGRQGGLAVPADADPEADERDRSRENDERAQQSPQELRPRALLERYDLGQLESLAEGVGRHAERASF